jgi:hypothetical protein
LASAANKRTARVDSEQVCHLLVLDYGLHTSQHPFNHKEGWVGGWEELDFLYYAPGRELKDDYEDRELRSPFDVTLAAIPQSLTGWET